jgi:RNA polymerase primary sigma factor
MASDLKTFFKSVGKTPLLTREEEVELSKRIEKGDRRARDHMIRANIRLAISIAKKYGDKGCDLEDLIQESSLGLIKAVDRFDWRKGFKFSTYACWWIKQAVRQHLASHSGTIRLPTYAKGTLWKMRQISEEYEKEFGFKPTQQEVADLLGTSVATLMALTKSAATTASLDGSAFKSDPDSARGLHEVLIDENAVNPEEAIDRDKLVDVVRETLSELSPREETVLRLRFGITEKELSMSTKEQKINAHA